MNKIIERTSSICPVCRKIIKADIVDENGSAYMIKECHKHGSFRNIVSEHSWYYKGLSSFYNTLFPQGHLLGKATFRNLSIHLTSECNLKCSICYADSLRGKYKEPSLREIKKALKTINGRQVISISGGEPTMREDLFQVIKLFHDDGHYIGLFTNGIKLKDIDYLRKLKKSGVDIVHINISSLSDDSVYEKMGMGKGLLKDKLAVLSNLRKLRLNTGIIYVAIPKLTDDYINEVTGFSLNNRFVGELSIRGYSHIGKLGFLRKDELTMDGLVKIFSRQTKGLVTLEEFYMFQKIIYTLRYIFGSKPQCYITQHIFIPRRGKKIRDIFPPDKMNRYMSIFEDIVKDNPFKAKKFFLSKFIPRMALFGQGLSAQNIFGKKAPVFLSRYYIPLKLCMFYTPYTLDLNRVARRCYGAWWHSYVEGKFDSYCKILSYASDTNIR